MNYLFFFAVVDVLMFSFLVLDFPEVVLRVCLFFLPGTVSAVSDAAYRSITILSASSQFSI
jgi:hypothetical protein